MGGLLGQQRGGELWLGAGTAGTSVQQTAVSNKKADQGRMLFGYMGLWVWVGIGPPWDDGLWAQQGTTWVISSWVATTRGGCGVQQAAVKTGQEDVVR
jgi:hypothetical protein